MNVNVDTKLIIIVTTLERRHDDDQKTETNKNKDPRA